MVRSIQKILKFDKMIFWGNTAQYKLILLK